jgi:hypothetical protein
LIPKREHEDQRSFDEIADEARDAVSDTELGTIY